jgi:very-short-patch-repair endonuclease
VPFDKLRAHNVLVDGQLFYIDIAFKRQKLAIEIDGRPHESDEDLFESDRWRQNALVADGWRVLRFTWSDPYRERS